MKNYLTDDPEAKRFVDFGKYLHDGREIALQSPIINRIRAEIEPGFAEAFLTGCDNHGLDPEHDDNKIAFLLFQLRCGKGHIQISLYMDMHQRGLAPLVFNDEDAYYYVLGHCGVKLRAAGQLERELDIIISLLKEIVENE